jgi:CheY-like chemotaxis protein
VNEIRTAADRAAALTRQLLAFSRQQSLALRVVDLNAVVAKAEARLRSALRSGVDLEVAYGPGGRINADAAQVEQVVLNLAFNAEEAMPHGGRLTIKTAQAELSEQQSQQLGVSPGQYVSVSVRDTGTGMDTETRAHLFEPFFTTKPREGAGLGLAVSYGIVAQSGGHITVESAPGQGTTLTVLLPRLAETAASPAASPAKIHVLPRRAETVLLVEDDEGVRKLVKRVLLSRGYAVLEARDGGEGLALSESQQGPIHLLITDVVMPRMGGFELAQRVASIHPETRVLYISGYTDDTVFRTGVQESEVPFLQKPFTPEVLAKRVRELLDQPMQPTAAPPTS